MQKSWRTKLLQAIETPLKDELSVQAAKKAGIHYWWIEDSEYKYCLAVEFGKYTAIPECKVSFYKVRRDDEYGVTSPTAEEKIYYPSWKATKYIASLNVDTNKIKEKNKYLHWLLSSTKEWLFICSDEQVEAYKSTVVPDLIRSFRAFVPADKSN